MFLEIPFLCRYNLAVTYGANTVQIYINGRLDATCGGITKNPATLPPLTNMYIGKSQYPQDGYFTGEVANFRWYNGLLRYVLRHLIRFVILARQSVTPRWMCEAEAGHHSREGSADCPPCSCVLFSSNPSGASVAALPSPPAQVLRTDETR